MITINTIESAIDAMYEKSGGKVDGIPELLLSLGGSLWRTNMYMRSTCMLRVTDEKTFSLYVDQKKADSMYEVLRGVGLLMLRSYDETLDAYVPGEYNVTLNGYCEPEMTWAVDRFASLVMIGDEELERVVEACDTFGEVSSAFALPKTTVLSRCQMMGHFLEMGVRSY